MSQREPIEIFNSPSPQEKLNTELVARFTKHALDIERCTPGDKITLDAVLADATKDIEEYAKIARDLSAAIVQSTQNLEDAGINQIDIERDLLSDAINKAAALLATKIFERPRTSGTLEDIQDDAFRSGIGSTNALDITFRAIYGAHEKLCPPKP